MDVDIRFFFFYKGCVYYVKYLSKFYFEMLLVLHYSTIDIYINEWTGTFWAV